MEPDDNPTYDGWIVRIDAQLIDITGLTSQDFPDCNLKQLFDKRISPEQAAEHILQKV